ncbi:hypothetical protein B484DRAFT_205806 [Ochromonadaceae sp. CCMP2298]|nr:hypothetical protein B484DRAFT_205806 [Ochromonadaceae sp. CCMP2298]
MLRVPPSTLTLALILPVPLPPPQPLPPSPPTLDNRGVQRASDRRAAGPSQGGGGQLLPATGITTAITLSSITPDSTHPPRLSVSPYSR